MNCLFCNIVSKAVDSQIVFEDDQVLAFHDIHPQAPTHILVIPKIHIPNITQFAPPHSEVLNAMFSAVKTIAHQHQLSQGFRLVTNIGIDGGQTVNHLHFHILGGRKMNWPPG